MACESFSYRVVFVSRVFNASSKTRDNLFVSFSVSEGLETVFSENRFREETVTLSKFKHSDLPYKHLGACFLLFFNPAI